MRMIVGLKTDANNLILTPREMEYLIFASLGYKNHEIGYILTVSKNTVKMTLKNVFVKLCVKDRTSAVTIAFIHGILNLENINYTREKFKEHIIELESRMDNT